MSLLFKQMAVVGVGLIGGSLAQAVKQRKAVGEILGIGRDAQRLARARERGIIDAFAARIDETLGGADLVVVATPVGIIVDLIKEMVPFLKKGAIITDAGSVKTAIVKEAETCVPDTLHFVGSHPIAGTENSGFESSFPSLFNDRKCIITPVAGTDPGALEKVKALWSLVGANVVCMDCEEHDRIFAAVSHLPHLVAYSMVNCLLTIDGFEENIFSYSAGGFKDFSRIAASHPEMWKDIVLMNKDKVLPALAVFQRYVSELKDAIERDDADKLLAEFNRARVFRRLLK
jgi:prephenate dehydrogenase